MSNLEGSKNYYTFDKGLVTDSSKLQPTEASCTYIDNINLNPDGSIVRRDGIDYEEDYVLNNTGYTSAGLATKDISVHSWDNVEEDSSYSIIVVRVGSGLYFFNKATNSISSEKLNGGATLDLLEGGGHMQSTSILGKLVLSAHLGGVYILSYDRVLDIVSIQSSLIKVRDTWGVDDGLAITTQPPLGLSEEHRYNLVNQGWREKNLLTFSPGQPGVSNNFPYVSYQLELGHYPSNAQVMAQNFDAATGKIRVNPQLSNEMATGGTPAARGSNIIDIFRRGDCRAEHMLNPLNTIKPLIDGDSFVLNSHYYNGATAINPLLEDRSVGGVAAVASYSGRVAYLLKTTSSIGTDSRSPQLGGLVCISQLVDSVENITSCYSEADPTSQDISDIVGTDGMVIRIVGMQNPHQLEEFQDKLLVFADNGVWEISGGTGKDFSGTNIFVRKVSEEGSISADSIVKTTNRVYYWGASSIYYIEQEGDTRVSISRDMLYKWNKTFYSTFKFVSKTTVTGIFNSADLKVYWMYNDTPEYTGVYNRRKYNRVLSYDLQLEAFTTYTVGDSGVDTPYIAGIIHRSTSASASASAQIIDNNLENIIDSLGNQVVSTETEVSAVDVDGELSFLTFAPGDNSEFTFSSIRDTDYIDWKTNDGVGVDAEAKLVTFGEILSDGSKKKQATYVNLFMSPVPTGSSLDDDGDLSLDKDNSCLIRAHWGWTEDEDSAKWSPQRQAYRINRLLLLSEEVDKYVYPYTVVQTKNKIRGRGTSMALEMTSEPKKGMHVLGTTISYGLNSVV